MRLTAALLALITLCGVFARPGTAAAEETQLSVVCTIFPIYDWTLALLGDTADEIDVSLVDPRAYLLSFLDLIRYQVRAKHPAWILNGKKIFEGIPTKEQLMSILDERKSSSGKD